jgi:drug/metabolite transporter (DMT)-like permease
MIIQPWILYAIINAFVTSFGLTNYKYLTDLSPNISITLALCFTIIGFFAIIYLLFNRREALELYTKNHASKLAIHVGLFAIFLISTRYLFFKSVNTSPNIGYTHMIVNLNVLVTFVLGYILFRQKINSKTLLGIILCLAGLFIIIHNS